MKQIDLNYLNRLKIQTQNESFNFKLLDISRLSFEYIDSMCRFAFWAAWWMWFTNFLNSIKRMDDRRLKVIEQITVIKLETNRSHFLKIFHFSKVLNESKLVLR